MIVIPLKWQLSKAKPVTHPSHIHVARELGSIGSVAKQRLDVVKDLYLPSPLSDP